MIVVTTSAAQTIAVGAAITFNSTVLNTGCQKCHLGAVTKLTTRGTHQITFTGNIGATAATTAAQVTVYNNGNPISGSTLISTTEAAGDLNNVSGTTYLNNCCGDYGTITVVNTGTTTLNVGAGATLTIN